jgi:hypothetical protein
MYPTEHASCLRARTLVDSEEDMTKRLLRLWGLLAICGLVACQSAASPTLAPSSTPVPTSTSVPTATPVPAVPTSTPVGEVVKEEKEKPTPTAAAEPAADAPTEPPWQIPRVSETDWTKGTDGAGLVVVEYSDFQ